MNNLEFWLLMGVYALHTVLVLGAAYLIMRAQNAFNARLHREVTGAIVMIEGKLNNAINSVREDMKKPELFESVGKGISKEVVSSVRNSLSGMYGNVVKTVNGPARDPISKFFYVLTARNKGSAIKKVMMDEGTGMVLPQRGGSEPVVAEVGAGSNPDSDKLAALNAEVSRLIEADPKMQKAIDAKAKELGLA